MESGDSPEKGSWLKKITNKFRQDKTQNPVQSFASNNSHQSAPLAQQYARVDVVLKRRETASQQRELLKEEFLQRLSPEDRNTIERVITTFSQISVEQARQAALIGVGSYTQEHDPAQPTKNPNDIDLIILWTKQHESDPVRSQYPNDISYATNDFNNVFMPFVRTLAERSELGELENPDNIKLGTIPPQLNTEGSRIENYGHASFKSIMGGKPIDFQQYSEPKSIEAFKEENQRSFAVLSMVK